MEKTAIEWLASELTEYLQRMYKSTIEQAKEMEKQQIIDTYNNGFDIWDMIIKEL